MKSISIDYHETGAFAPMVLSYLDQTPKLSPFYSFPPTIDGFKQLIASKKNTCNRPLLTTILKDQYSRSGLNSEAVISHINLLEKNSTYTITTGHQLNIFTGPLYFIYKIATAIKLASDLKKEIPENDFVPVYWMATEDHDFAEINHTTLGNTELRWEHEPGGATGRMDLKAIGQTVRKYLSILGISPNSNKLADIIKEAYSNNSTLSNATRSLVHALFGEYGLVIIDADDKRLKQDFSAIIEKDIIEKNSFREIIETSKSLESEGFSTQVNSREINFFYLAEGLRERIVYKNGKYVVLNTTFEFSTEELRAEINKNADKFSPNVVMRPVYEEFILPNLAYIGGGAEIVYWLQLKGVFDCYGIDFPILVLRNSALISDESTHVKLYKSGLTFKDLFKNIDNLKKDWVLKYSDNNLSLNLEWQELQLSFEKIKSKAAKIDPTLGPSAEAVSARLHKALLKLEQKLIRAEKRNFSTDLSKIELAKLQLFPGGTLQERKENFGLLYVKYGDELIAELIKHFKPLDFKFTILY